MNGMDGKTGKEQYYKFNDGWFTYYVNVKTGKKKFKLNEQTDIEVEQRLDEEMFMQRWLK